MADCWLESFLYQVRGHITGHWLWGFTVKKFTNKWNPGLNIPPLVSGAEDRISCNISLLWYILLEEKPLIDIFQCLDFQHVWKIFLEFVGLKWSSASDLRYEKDLHDGNYLNKVNIEGRDIVRKSFLSWLIVDMMSVLHIVCLFSG